jgi:hypothetical protein
MTRTILPLATAALAAMAFFAPAAEACISCEYVPPVANSASKSSEATHSDRGRPSKAAEERRSRPAKKRIIESETDTKKVETAKAAPIDTQSENESSTISTGKLSETVAKKFKAAETAPIKAQTENESSTISPATLVQAEETPTDDTKVTRNVGCKKFFPTVGLTLTVPCE